MDRGCFGTQEVIHVCIQGVSNCDVWNSCSRQIVSNDESHKYSKVLQKNSPKFMGLLSPLIHVLSQTNPVHVNIPGKDEAIPLYRTTETPRATGFLYVIVADFQPYSPAAFTPQRTFFVLVSVRG